MAKFYDTGYTTTESPIYRMDLGPIMVFAAVKEWRQRKRGNIPAHDEYYVIVSPSLPLPHADRRPETDESWFRDYGADTPLKSLESREEALKMLDDIVKASF